MMKKTLAVLMTAALAASCLTACGGGGSTEESRAIPARTVQAAGKRLL